MIDKITFILMSLIIIVILYYLIIKNIINKIRYKYSSKYSITEYKDLKIKNLIEFIYKDKDYFYIFILLLFFIIPIIVKIIIEISLAKYYILAILVFIITNYLKYKYVKLQIKKDVIKIINNINIYYSKTNKQILPALALAIQELELNKKTSINVAKIIKLIEEQGLKKSAKHIINILGKDLFILLYVEHETEVDLSSFLEAKMQKITVRKKIYEDAKYKYLEILILNVLFLLGILILSSDLIVIGGETINSLNNFPATLKIISFLVIMTNFLYFILNFILNKENAF